MRELVAVILLSRVGHVCCIEIYIYNAYGILTNATVPAVGISAK